MARADDRVTHILPSYLKISATQRSILLLLLLLRSISFTAVNVAVNVPRGDRMRSFDRFKMDDGGVVEGC